MTRFSRLRHWLQARRCHHAWLVHPGPNAFTIVRRCVHCKAIRVERG